MSAIRMKSALSLLLVSLIWALASASPLAQERPPEENANLLTNGDFSQGFSGWSQEVFYGCGGTQAVNLISSDPPYSDVAEILSSGAGACGHMNSLYQTLNIPLAQYPSLAFSADLKAISSSVANGCGDIGHEHPVELHLSYTDLYGTSKTIKWGFYFGSGSCPAPASEPNTIWIAVAVPQGQWFHFSSGDLGSLIPEASYLNRVTLAANGWDYSGRADNLRLETGASPGGSLWAKALKGSGSRDEVRWLQATSDGGAVAAGFTSTFGAGNLDLWVVRLDSYGSVLWQKTFGGSGEDVANHLCMTSDGGCLVTGWTRSYGPGNGEAWLLRLDGNGNVLWQETLTNPGADDEGNSVEQTPDLGFLWTVNTTSSDGIKVIRLSSSGTILWQKKYGGEAWGRALSTSPTADGGFYLMATQDSYGSTVIAKMDPSGSPSWARKFRLASSNWAYRIRRTSDGGFVALNTTSGKRLHVLKGDSSGVVSWEKTYGTGTEDQGTSIEAAADGGYLLSGYSGSFDGGSADLWMAKLDSSGNILWQRLYGQSGKDWAAAISASADGTLLVGGCTSALGSGTDSVILKVDSSGNIPGCPYLSAGALSAGALSTTPEPLSLAAASMTYSTATTWASGAQSSATEILQCSAGGACTLSCSASSSVISDTAVQFMSSVSSSGCSGTTTYLWTFGDGQSSAEANPSHSYSSSGTYNWTFTASNGSASCPKTGSVTVGTSSDLLACFAFDGSIQNPCSTTGQPSFQGSGSPTYVSGVQGQALSLDGSAYVKVPLTEGPTGSFTTSFFLQPYSGDPDDSFGGAFIVDRDICNAPQPDWTITINRGYKIGFNVGLGGDSFLYSASDVSTDRFRHVALVYDRAAQMRYLYMDGQLEASAPESSGALSTSYPIYIGASVCNTSSHDKLKGAIDNVHLYNHALTAQEVLDDCKNGGGCGSSVPPPVIAALTKLGDPFRIKVAGTNLQYGIRVYVNGVEWTGVSYKNTGKIVLTGGKSLKALVPKGASATFRFVNPDGGEATRTWSW